MPLNTPGLKTAIEGILTDMEKKTEDAKSEFAQRLASAIEVFVKTGTVVTTGSATTQTGTIT